MSQRAIKSVCIFCGSSVGAKPAYLAAAKGIGAAFQSRGLEMVFGGAHVGLMGAAADACLAEGVRVTGVIPHFLSEMEAAHSALTELVLVDTMHERKRTMAERSDAFLVLPGGLGTLEELTEILTWTQLALHDKPLALLNIGGYFDHLLAFLDHAEAEGFLPTWSRAGILVGERFDEIWDQMLAWEAPRRPAPVGLSHS
jgi:uncharacterized protein (TIGR00730 family)